MASRATMVNAMNVDVEFTTDPGRVVREAEAYLLAEPVLHNLMLTVLHARMLRKESGRYWIARDDGAVRGVVFQSPLHFPAALSLLSPGAVAPLVRAILAAGVLLPGANGEAGTVARFAGEWAEQRKAPARPVRGQRIYVAEDLVAPKTVGGHLRPAMLGDRDLMTAWIQAFRADVDEPGIDADAVVQAKLEDRMLWIWDNDGPVAVAAHSEPVAGIARVQYVYTPPPSRKRGYASACVFELSSRLHAQGWRCMLFTDLANPTSNSVYRAIGYRAVAEALQYRFDPAPSA
jgi:uncharacterized protein